MKKTIAILAFLSWLPAFATTYKIIGNSVTIHVGEPLPPCTYHISAYAPPYSAVFAGAPACSFSNRVRTSAAGVYSDGLVVAQNTMRTVRSEDTLVFVPGSVTVELANPNGAVLTNNVAAPLDGIFKAPNFAMINVKSNTIPCTAAGCPSSGYATLVGDGVTDDTVALQQLLAYNRAAGTLVVSTSGTTITVSGSGTFPPSLAGTVLIAGIHYTIALHVSPTQITVTTPPPSLTNAYLYFGGESHGFGRQPKFLYFPAASPRYLITAPINIFGNYVTLLGVGPRQSIIYLAPKNPYFNPSGPNDASATKPQPFINYNSIHGNENFQEYISGMGFEIGAGNPFTEIIKWVNNNGGKLSNTLLWADDSECSSALALQHAYSGPTYINNVEVIGCQYGVRGGQQEYNAVLEGLTVEGQTVAGIYNASFHMTIRHMLNANTVPAITQVGRYSSIAMLDSELAGPGSSVAGITTAPGGQIYGRNITCVGYRPCNADSGSGTLVSEDRLPLEFGTGEWQSLFNKGDSPSSLNLPEAEAPIPADPPPSRWIALGKDPSTWNDALNSCTSPTTAYLAPGAYDTTVNGAVRNGTNINLNVPDCIVHLQFYGSMFAISSNRSTITMNVAGSSKTPLVIENCQSNQCTVNHSGPRVVELLDCSCNYNPSPGAGDVFLTAVSPPGSNVNSTLFTFPPGQKVWARELDIENNGNKFVCRGCTLWIEGYKTEQDSPSVVLEQGAEAEIFGFFFYQLHLDPAPENSSPIYLEDSDLFANGFIYVNGPTHSFGAPRWVNEKQQSNAQYLPMPDVSHSYLMNKFYSYGKKSRQGSNSGQTKP